MNRSQVFNTGPLPFFRVEKAGKIAVFHTGKVPAEPSQSPAGEQTERVGCKNKPSRADKVPERAYKTIFYALAAAHTRVCSGAGISFSLL